MTTNGLLFRELEETDASYALDRCLVLVSKQREDGMTYSSRSITMQDLAAQIAEDLDAAAGISSAAYYMSSDFALQDHDHDIYTSAIFEPAGDQSQRKSIAKFIDYTNNQSADITIDDDYSSAHEGIDKISSILAEMQPAIAELQILAVSSIDDTSIITDITSPGFEGWVPADGSSYPLSAFQLSGQLSTAFIYDIQLSTFTVPDMSLFFKLKCRASSEFDIQHGETALPDHTHKIEGANVSASFDISGLSSNDVGFNTYEGYSQNNTSRADKGCIHHGNVNESTTVQLYRSVNVTEGNLAGKKFKTSEDGDPNAQSYPSHDVVPALIYVGRSRSSNPLVALT